MSMRLYSKGLESIISITNLLYYRNFPILRSYIYKNHSIHEPYIFDTCMEIFILRNWNMMKYIKSHKMFSEYNIDPYDFSDIVFGLCMSYDTNLSRMRITESINPHINGMSCKGLLINRYGYLVYLQIENIINRYGKKYRITTSRQDKHCNPFTVYKRFSSKENNDEDI